MGKERKENDIKHIERNERNSELQTGSLNKYIFGHELGPVISQSDSLIFRGEGGVRG
jgi:hypothetical protein